MRLKHYSIRTERTYGDWVRRFIHVHRMRTREELLPAEPKIEAFLSELAVKGAVAVSTQNQAMNALVFLCRQVLKAPLDERMDAAKEWSWQYLLPARDLSTDQFATVWFP